MRVLLSHSTTNGWDEVTASLQLVAHLDGEALNVALLVPESQRILPGVLLKIDSLLVKETAPYVGIWIVWAQTL